MADNLTIPVATNEVGGFHFQKIKLIDGTAGSTDEIQGDATNGLDVDVTRMPGQFAEDAAHTNGDIGNLALVVRKDSAAALAGTDGDYAPLEVDASGRLWVNPTSSGDVAHDSADSGNPIKVGGRAVATLSSGTPVTAGDRSDVVTDLDGALITRSSPHGDRVSGNATNTDGSSTQCLAAAGSGIKTVLTDVTLANSSATSITVDIKDGSTVKWTFPVPAGGGVTHRFETPLVGTANTAWNFDPSAAATTVTCSMSGYKSKV